MLRKGVRHLLEYGCLGHDTIRLELERVAALHQYLNLEVGQLRRFIEVLIDLVLERDPHAVDANEKELLRRDWERAIEFGLTPFLEIAAAKQAATTSPLRNPEVLR
jgi:hypothetical protein